MNSWYFFFKLMINADRFCLGDDQEKKKHTDLLVGTKVVLSNIPTYSKDKSLCFRISLPFYYFCVCKALTRDPDGFTAV